MSKATLVLTSIAVLVGVFIVGSVIANFLFKGNVEQEVKTLFSNVENKGEIVTEEDIEGLPQNVQIWLEYAGVVGMEKIAAVRLKQKANMRLGVDKPWMPVEAEQYFTSEEPSFIWKAKIKVAPLIHIAGRDKYQDGKGNMLIKALSLLTVADSEGKEIDQGTLLRYLAETMWFPSAVLKEYITWEEIDEDNAKATMTYGDITASGIFTFNDNGEVIKFEAERYGEFDGEFSLETWSISLRDYKEFEGVRVPSKGEVTWKLGDGDFTWFNFEVTEIQYNKPIPY
ncbi:hypothetical protein CACET_c30900 [Clostridium aceticum]|uniref:Uncharacterized protein n=1 Tax=Clostridium aceticum TaxID=84022 RepID=A0A0D8IB94_9CLOT|nr:DUF6544 family protein [Clostridium aceticum]AKL96534.1 hypothetical protein CACET_c30900 [Clostridium aceticum]KJF27302.1 hypothetical protein TZ02_08145 [Clostridium aceticum]